MRMKNKSKTKTKRKMKRELMAMIMETSHRMKRSKEKIDQVYTLNTKTIAKNSIKC